MTIRHGLLKVGSKRSYLLSSDGINSKVHTAPSLFTMPKPVWSAGAQFGGVYTTIREGNVDGAVLAYGPQNITTAVDACMLGPAYQATSMVVFDFTEGQLGWNSASGGTGWTASGWVRHECGGCPNEIAISYDLGGFYDVRWIEVFHDSGGGKSIFGTTGTRPGHTGASGHYSVGADASGTPTICTDFFVPSDMYSDPGDTTIVDRNGHYPWKVQTLVVHIGGSFGESEFHLTKINLGIIGAVPATPHRTTTVRYSSDHGANFGSALNVVVDGVGAVNGFDVQHNGTVSYAAGALKVRKATTLGGAYSDDQSFDVNPVMVECPWNTRNSLTALNSGSSPEYIVGLVSADGSGHTLYWIVGGVKVNITPVIGGTAGIPVGPDCLTTWKGKYVAGLFSFSGTTHLMTSSDGGITWIDRGAVDALYVRVRRLANQPGQFYAAGNVFDYTNTFGAKLVSKTKPGALVFFEAYN
jgi:hypothetical protein